MEIIEINFIGFQSGRDDSDGRYFDRKSRERLNDFVRRT